MAAPLVDYEFHLGSHSKSKIDMPHSNILQLRDADFIFHLNSVKQSEFNKNYGVLCHFLLILLELCSIKVKIKS